MDPEPRATIGTRAARIALTATKKFILIAHSNLVVGGAQEAVQSDLGGAHVVDKDVDATVVIEGSLDEAGRCVGGREVQRHAGHSGQLAQAVGRSSAGYHAGTLRGEFPRHCEPDPLACGRDDGDPLPSGRLGEVHPWVQRRF